MKAQRRFPPLRPSIALLAALSWLSVWAGCPCPAGVHDDSREYYLPYPFLSAFLVGQGNMGLGEICPACSHFGRYAIDFVMEQGTPVTAARGGTVLGVRDTCPDVNCPWAGTETPECCGNYVTVTHDDQTTAQYWHLQPGGVLVAPGDPVQRGDVLGLSGNTGISIMPHLHFAAKVPDGDTSCQSLGCPTGHGCGSGGCSQNATTEAAFADVCGSGVPELGWIYTSQNAPR